MNLSFFFGCLTAVVVFIVSIFSATTSRGVFLDHHGILVVVGGTLAAAFISFPIKTLFVVSGVALRRMMFKQQNPHQAVINEIVNLSEHIQTDENSLRERAARIQTPFLKEGVELLVEGGLSESQLDMILKKRSDVMFKRNHKEASVFKTLSKFPPAFGLMGTTIGMIALLQSLGGQDAYKKLGPAMAIGLVATLYGIALANFIFIPISENLLKMNEEDSTMRDIVIDGIKLLRKKEHPLVVAEFLKSYLSPSERGLVVRGQSGRA